MNHLEKFNLDIPAIASHAHKITLKIRPEVSGDYEYWRIRTIIQEQLDEFLKEIDNELRKSTTKA